MFVALQAAGKLMQDEGDWHRDALERTARLRATATTALPSPLADAFKRREQDVAIRLADRVDLRLLVSAAGDEVWVAISTREADGAHVGEPVRDVLFRIAFDVAEAEISEPRQDWPSGALEWFEVARLGLREAR